MHSGTSARLRQPPAGRRLVCSAAEAGIVAALSAAAARTPARPVHSDAAGLRKQLLAHSIVSLSRSSSMSIACMPSNVLTHTLTHALTQGALATALEVNADSKTQAVLCAICFVDFKLRMLREDK